MHPGRGLGEDEPGARTHRPHRPRRPARRPRAHHSPVRSRGVLSYQGHTLYLGTQWAGEPIRLTHAPGRLTLTHPTTERHLTTITWPPPTPYTNLTDHCQKS